MFIIKYIKVHISVQIHEFLKILNRSVSTLHITSPHIKIFFSRNPLFFSLLVIDSPPCLTTIAISKSLRLVFKVVKIYVNRIEQCVHLSV